MSTVLDPETAVFRAGLLPAPAPAGLPARSGAAPLVLVPTVLTGLRRGGYVLLLPGARAFFGRPAVRRGMDRVTGAVLTGSGPKVAAARP